MQKIIFIFSLMVICLSLGSCDTREDVFFKEKENPVLNYMGTSNNYLSLDFKLKNIPYQKWITLSDIDKVKLRVEGGNGYFTIDANGNNVYNQDVELDPGNYLLNFETDSTGSNMFFIIAKDRYDKRDTLFLNLNVFYNWNPTASFIVNQQPGGYPHEYTFNSSASIDQDQAYGGGIIRYIYTIDGVNLNDSLNVPYVTFNYVFPEAGNYNIKHWTMDNDSALSAPYIQSVSIN